MAICTAINGFGRMRCLALRMARGCDELEFVHINETAGDTTCSATQTIIDKGHKVLRRARACDESLIPTSTGSSKAITQIFPELTGKLNGLAELVCKVATSL
ncbi:glyceraldehyde 3-phosphate dehydrogenase-like protein [Thiogranum longum]|uniref:Glyceraldehyde 3-phosphate dehydrogenase-like protein n=1 Tax=Thiogranum longum TaxID=1537524 RepID=A0A4R1HCX3_9GAMM|nr:glyceraldehyde 3-phosphate dehydrogenase-like protein [Thiogranum longum]